MSVLSYLVVGRRVTPIIYRKVSVKWQKSIAVDKQLPWSLWLGLQATWSHQTWHAHGQSIAPGATVVRFIVSFRGPASHTNDLPPSKCEMAKVNCCRPFRPGVALVALARPAGELETPNLACAWPVYRPRCCRCPFHRIFPWARMSHQ